MNKIGCWNLQRAKLEGIYDEKHYICNPIGQIDQKTHSEQDLFLELLLDWLMKREEPPNRGESGGTGSP